MKAAQHPVKRDIQLLFIWILLSECQNTLLKVFKGRLIFLLILATSCYLNKSALRALCKHSSCTNSSVSPAYLFVCLWGEGLAGPTPSTCWESLIQIEILDPSSCLMERDDCSYSFFSIEYILRDYFTYTAMLWVERLQIHTCKASVLSYLQPTFLSTDCPWNDF